MKHLAPIAATAIVLLFLLVSSVPLMHWFVREGREASLTENQALWRDRGIENYDFTIQMDCFCPPPAGTPIRIAVRGGSVADAGDSRHRDSDADTDTTDIPDSIPAMFSTVRAGIDADPDSIEISYHGDYGFPESIRIDYRKAHADDEVVFTISDFRPLRDRTE